MSDVTLTIKVKDGEVVAATKNVQNLEKAAKNVGKTSVGLGGDRSSMAGSEEERLKRLAAFMGKDLPKAAQDATAAVTETAAATGTAESSLVSLGAAAGPAGAAILAIGAILIGAAVVAYDAAKAYAAYAMSIRDMVEETGLAAQTAAGLRLELAAQGRSATDLNGVIAHFRDLIGEAAGQSDEARKKLSTLGIDGSKAIYDIDGAFRTAVAAITAAPDELTKVKLATAAFGDEGARKLIPFLKDAHGNLDEMTKQAERFMGQISGKNLEDAKAYTRAVADMDAAWEGFKNNLGSGVLPYLTTLLEKLQAGVLLIKQYPSLLLGGAAGAATLTQEQIDNAVNPPSTPVAPTPTLDPNAAAKMLAEQEKVQKAALDKFKEDIDEAISYVKNKGTELQDNLQRAFESVQESFEKSGDVQTFQKQVDEVINQYIKKVTIYENVLKDLEARRSAKVPPTAIGAAALQDEQAQRTQNDADKYVVIQKKAADLIAKYNEKTARDKERSDHDAAQAEKRAIMDHLADVSAAMSQEMQMRSAENQWNAYLNQKYLDNGEQTERSYVDYIRQQTLDTIELKKWALQQEIDATEEAISKRGDIEGQLNKRLIALRGQMAVAEKDMTTATDIPALTTEDRIRQHINLLLTDNIALIKERRSLAATSEKDSLISEITALKDALANGGVNDGLAIEAAHLRDILDMRHRELDAVIRINRAQLELAHSQEISNNQIRASVYEHMAAASNLNDAIASGINNTFDAISGQMDKQLDKLNDWSHGFLSFITEPLKAMAHKQLSDIFSGVLDSIFPGAGLGDLMNQTNNPVAQPIVKKIDETNKLLSQLVSATGQVPAAGGLGSLGGLISGGLGSLGGGGIFSGGGGRGGYILNAAGGGNNDLFSTLMSEGSNAPGAPGSPGSGGILANLGRLFSTGPGGIFAPQKNILTGKNSSLGGIMGGIGGLAQIAGGLVGGRLGNILSYAGTGLQIGAMFGPIGAGIGAAVGALIGIFGGDPKKKKDERENMPQLQKGFSDATSQLTQILQDIRMGNGDPDSAVSKAREIRAQIASGFGIQFGSKKYQKQSAQAIAQQLQAIDSEPDGLMAQIIKAAAIARGSADRMKRILPEFAGGNYFADFFRPNGLLPGMFDGADNILAMISRGEMVLNPMQQNRVRSLAGGDVFAHAGIPNYPRGSMSSKLAGGGVANAGLSLSAGPTNVTVNPTIVLEGVTFNDGARAYIESDDGKRTLVSMLKKETGLTAK